MNAAQTPAVRKAAATQQATLDALVALAMQHVGDGLMEMVKRMSAALLDMTDATLAPQEAAHRIRSGNLLRDNAYAFVHLASTGIELALRREIALLAPGPKPAQAAPQALSLVPMEEIDSQLAFAAISRPFDLQQSERLAGLGVRLGLLLGRELVRAGQNPFRPEVFLRALREAWQEFEPDPHAHALVLPLLRPGIVFALGPMLDALGERLKPARGRDGEARFAKTDDSAAARAARARRDAAVSRQLRQLFGADDGSHGGAGGELDIPLIPDLPQGSGGWRPSAAPGFAGALQAPIQPTAPAHTLRAGAAPVPGRAGPPPGSACPPASATACDAAPVAHPAATSAAARSVLLAEALDSLAAGLPADQGAGASTAHEVFYLPRLKQSLPHGSLSRGDETTLDLLSRIFEAVLLDDGIPQETRELIAFLQVPVLRAALKDRSFFFEETHPARRMLDLLSQAGWGQGASPEDPLYRAMRRGVDKVRGAARPGDSVQAFAAAVAELEAGIAEREQAEQAAIAGPIARATRQEKAAAAARSAHKAVAHRLALAGGQVVALVSSFLEQRWTPVLTLAYTIEEGKPGAVENATRAMDDLIWSVKPKATQEQRQALIKRLPALLAALNRWLDAVKWQDAERLQFFAELAEYHASIVRAPLELSPERQLELAVEAAQQDALHRIALEQAGAADEDAARDPAAAQLAALERGMRFELRGETGVRKLRLAWVSPLRTLFIFAGSSSQEAFSLPAERLLDAFRSGSIRVLAPEGVVGRVLTQAVGEAAMNDSLHGLAHAG
ncbi:DUF1631 family protein [Massilia sp. MS-15]|uniref:DUF1631 family protein n=1 Tax=Massilia sp. MS-15 TaxID=2878200 RepID=UPI001CD2D6F0|nr:DUF1631 domain-containing protein [Massilia sp. MS-15]